MKKHLIKTAICLMAAGTLLLSACKASFDPNETVVTVNGGEDTVSLGYANFVAKYNQAIYDSYYVMYFGDDVWTQEIDSEGTTFESQTKEQIMQDMKATYAVCQQAETYGVSLSEEEVEQIALAAQSFMESNSEEAIEQMGAKEEFVIEMLTNETIAAKVQKALRDEAVVSVSDDESQMRTISYVVFSTAGEMDEEGNIIEKTEEELTELEEAAELFASFEDFDEAVDETEAEVLTHTYLISDGSGLTTTLDSSLTDAANRLEEGEWTDVIYVEGSGYYILRLDQKIDEAATADKKAEVEDQKRNEYASEQVEAWADAVDWEINEAAWAKVKFKPLFSQKIAE